MLNNKDPYSFFNLDCYLDCYCCLRAGHYQSDESDKNNETESTIKEKTSKQQCSNQQITFTALSIRLNMLIK